MAYCRWSSDNFGCDLYCYEDFRGGWTTHVAAKRIVGEIPVVNDALLMQEPPRLDEWHAQYAARDEALENAKREPIGRQFDGQTFNDSTLETFRDRLLTLRDAGYRFPDYVLTEIDAEIAERDRAPAAALSPAAR